MGAFVRDQTALVAVYSAAYITDVWSVGVNVSVRVQRTDVAESSVAHVADEWFASHWIRPVDMAFVTGVNAFVPLEIAQFTKSLITYVTDVRSLAGVSAFVCV